MKFRTKIFLLFIFVCFLITAVLGLIGGYLDYIYKNEAILIEKRYFNEIFEWENSHFANRLGSFAELYINAEAENLADEVMKEYAKAGNDYKALESNAHIRNVFRKSGLIDETKSTHIELVYDRKIILVSLNPKAEGKNIEGFLDSIVDPHIRTWYKTLEGSGVQYFDYYDTNSKSNCRLYGVIYRIPDTKLSISYVININSYIKPLGANLISERDSLKKNMSVAVSDSFKTLQKYKWLLLITSAVIILLLLIPLIHYISASITKPITDLRNEAMKMGQGNFNIKMSETGTVEISDLIHSFNALGNNLAEHISKLKEEIATREKLSAELEIARKIQESLIPNVFPSLGNFRVYGRLIPAKEVGGDFYDFFFIDKDHFCFVIGDVSGKGIPAAIFMAITRTLIRAKITNSSSLSELMNEINNEIMKENASCMFVTLFIGILNIRKNEIEYYNAGHNSPLLATYKRGLRYTFPTKSYPLGVAIDGVSRYITENINLSKGDILFLYTDGITEAINQDNVLFSDDKLKEVFIKNMDRDLAAILAEVYSSVQFHAKNMEQSDDIAMLILKCDANSN